MQQLDLAISTYAVMIINFNVYNVNSDAIARRVKSNKKI